MRFCIVGSDKRIDLLRCNVNARFSMRMFLIAWLLLLAILGAYAFDSDSWVHDYLPFSKVPADNRRTINVASYISGQTPPVSLGDLKKSENGYIHLKLRFRVDGTEGNPNVFQTAPANRGMRMEISGATAAIVVPDFSVLGGLKGLILSTAIKPGQWYALEVEALNGAFVRVIFDGHLVANYSSAGLDIEFSQVHVGAGFDASRAFGGRIEDISITKGNIAAPFVKKPAIDNYSEIVAASYSYGKTPPVVLGKIVRKDHAYVHLKLRFRADSTEEVSTVFQTASGNLGLRMDISGSSASLSVPDPTVPGKLKELALTTALKAGQWYALDVAALNGSFVHATLDGVLVADYASAGLSMDMSRLLVGGASDEFRVFRGQIENISLASGNHPALLYKSRGVIFSFFSALFIGLFVVAATHFRISVFYIGLMSSLLVVAIYNFFLFNSYFPITEGWFSAYAHLINQGLVPYRDFYFFMTPLYPLQIAAFQSVFGDSFVALRILGILVILLLTSLIYLILAGRFSPTISTVAAVTAIIYYQSGVAHISYDFIQFFNLFALLATYLIIRYANSDHTEGRNKDHTNLLFVAGLVVSLAFLTKQSNGALVVLFSTIAVALATPDKDIVYRLRGTSIYILGMAIPVFIVTAWLYFADALRPFIDQVIFGAIDAKGTIWKILFSWIGRHANGAYLYQLKISLIYIFPLLILSLLGKFFLQKKRFEGIPEKRDKMNWEIFLFPGCLFIAVGLSYYGGELFKPWMVIPGFKVDEVAVAVSTAFAGAWVFCLVLPSLAGINLRNRDLAVSATMTLGLIFGNGTSGGIGEASVFLFFAFTLAFLMNLPHIYGIARVVVGIICFSFILFLANNKFKQPYAWWQVSAPDVRESSTHSELPLLAGFRLSSDSIKLLEETTRIIQTYSRPDEDVFTFPNIPLFYVLADRWPHSMAVVSWFDFLPDNLAKAEAIRLRVSPPSIIVNLKLPEIAWDAHESLFRSGKHLGQRDIQAVIVELTEVRKLYQLDFSQEVSAGSVLEVWRKRIQ